MPWATVQDVEDVVDLTVTTGEIRRAMSTLETVTGLIAETSAPVAPPGGIIESFDFTALPSSTGLGAFASGTATRYVGDLAAIEITANNPTGAPINNAAFTLTTDAAWMMDNTLEYAGEGAQFWTISWNAGLLVSILGTLAAGETRSVRAGIGLAVSPAPEPVGGDLRADISDRDRYFLRLMTCYQVAFMAENPDLFSRADVTSASQDGESASFRNVDSHLFAPLARKAYRRLSWRARRLMMPDGSTPVRPSSIDVNSEAYDDALPWEPM